MSNPVKTILILAANPANTSRLRLDQEVREIEEGLKLASKGGQFRLVQKWAVRSRDFYRAILEHQPQIVHFCGHGTGVDGIVKQKQAQRIFLSLVRVGDETGDTRRVTTRNEIGQGNWDLVIYLAGSEARLVVTGRNDKSGEETVEVVHEALIREWKRLREWIDNSREKLIQHRKIEAGAIEWRDKGKSKDYLLGGKQLNEANTFQKEQASFFTLSGLASEFIQKSIKYKYNNRFKFVYFILIPLTALTFSVKSSIEEYYSEKQIKIDRLRSTIEAESGKTNSQARISALQELVKLGVALNNIQLNKANLSRADLSGADLINANLFGANLGSANLSDANLGSANLSSAVLVNANLESANLSSADLVNADLVNANLSAADLSGANLSGANLSGADLQKAQYTDTSTSKQTCENFTNFSLSKYYACPTHFPPKDFDPKKAGMELLK